MLKGSAGHPHGVPTRLPRAPTGIVRQAETSVCSPFAASIPTVRGREVATARAPYALAPYEKYKCCARLYCAQDIAYMVLSNTEEKRHGLVRPHRV